MKFTKMILLALIVVVAVVFAFLLFSASSSNQTNLDNANFDELFSSNEIPYTLSEETALSETVDIGELFQ